MKYLSLIHISMGAVERLVISGRGPYTAWVRSAAEDAYTRLLQPSLEREVRGALTERAIRQAISVFAANLKPLLLQPPLRGKVVLGFDPGYRTGCKVAVDVYKRQQYDGVPPGRLG